MRENMPVLRETALFRSSFHPSKEANKCAKKQINARKYASFTLHRTIQIFFHPAKEANK
jgi:hypothetical protein